MKRFFNLLSVFVLLLGLSGVANAYTINWDYLPSGSDGNELTSPYSGVTIETFDGAASLDLVRKRSCGKREHRY